MKDKFEILNILRLYSYLGQHQTENGTLLIGKAPHIAPQAWLHRIFEPLSDSQIKELELKMKISIPHDYRCFLNYSNGLGVFNTTLSLYGMTFINNRTVESTYQPFDIVRRNVIERPANAHKDVLFIGSYSWDLSLLFIDPNTNKVHICKRDDATPIFEWSSFSLMLEQEIKRLATLFDSEGKKIKTGSTLPK